MKNKVLVIGGSGFLGSHVADALSDRGFQVIIIDKKKSNWIKKNQKFVAGDITKPNKFFNFLQKAS